jgi:methyltransferase family protein
MGSYMVSRPDAREAATDSQVRASLASGADINFGFALTAAGLSQTELVRGLRRQIHEVIEGRSFFDPYVVDAVCMRVLVAIAALQEYFREEQPNDKAPLLRHLRRVLLDLDESGLNDAKIRCFLADSIRYLEPDVAAETLQRSGGEDEELSASVRRIPTMLCKETLGYYKWLARTFEGPGDIVELGSWMGSSTACLAEGLAQNPNRRERRIHAYDSFIWRDWMRTYTEDADLLASNISEGESFLQHFCDYIEPFRHLIEVHRSVLKTGAQQLALPALAWGGQPISILVMDFAHDRASNEAVWRLFSPSFESGSTIVIFNQFGNIPAGEVRALCREKGSQLVPLHKPRSSAKAFRYYGAAA